MIFLSAWALHSTQIEASGNNNTANHTTEAIQTHLGPGNGSYPNSVMLQERKENVTNVTFGNAAATSILRPALFDNLLTKRPWKTASSKLTESIGFRPKDEIKDQAEDEEEEVTQTIELPFQQQPEEEQVESVDEGSPESESSTIQHEQLKENFGRLNGRKGKLPLGASSQALSMLLRQRANGVQRDHRDRGYLAGNLKPEASLTLSSAEMSSILHDREGPEGYRSRELMSDGVVIGEEQPRLGTAASAHYQSDYSPFGMGGGLPGAGLPYGETVGPVGFGPQRLMNAESEHYGSGFNHRFGSLEDERMLHQSNGFNEMGYGAGSGGLMRSPSGSEFEGVHTSGFYGHHNQGLDTGFSHHPGLDSHASEIAGGGGYDSYESPRSSPMEGYYGATGGRLQMAKSQMSDFHHHGFPPSSYGSDESMNGLHHGPSSEESAYGLNARSLLQRSGDGYGKLMPLSPIIPTSDELPGSMGAASNGGDQFLRAPHQGSSKSRQIYRPDTSTRQVISSSKQIDTPQRASMSPKNEEEEYEPIGEEQSDSEDTGSMQSQEFTNQRDQFLRAAQESGPSVEFARIGSAGYLGPVRVDPQPVPEGSKKKLIKKISMEPREAQVIYDDPVDNPAHRGKYIIE